jgi:hypothetical protein
VSISFDQSAYAPGETITATVTYAPGVSLETEVFTGIPTDTVSDLKGATVTENFVISQNDSTSVAVSDSGNRTWTPVSNTGTVAVFTATA